MKIFKTIIFAVLIIALSVGATALISRATNGFNDGISNIFYNEDNLVRSLDEYVSKEGSSGKGISWTVKSSGAVIADGTLSSSYDTLRFIIGTVEIKEEGFYTLSGAPLNTDTATWGIRATYEDVAGVQQTLYANIPELMTSPDKLTAGTMVTIEIFIESGMSVENLKFTPTFVRGTEAGSF